MENKRNNDRVDTKVKSEVHSEDGMTFSSSINLSQGGIFITTPEPLCEGSEVNLSLHIPGENPVDIKGVVRWTRTAEDETVKSGMGIEFVDIADVNIDSIKKIIK